MRESSSREWVDLTLRGLGFGCVRCEEKGLTIGRWAVCLEYTRQSEKKHIQKSKSENPFVRILPTNSTLKTVPVVLLTLSCFHA